tara:strand:- start:100 stop:363 length:264 start_codon:yes stop_codon:yes gene_type:complete
MCELRIFGSRTSAKIVAEFRVKAMNRRKIDLDMACFNVGIGGLKRVDCCGVPFFFKESNFYLFVASLWRLLGDFDYKELPTSFIGPA